MELRGDPKPHQLRRERVAIVSRRRGSFDWVSTPDEGGDAAAASRDIEDWLRTRGSARDWAGVLGQLRDALVRIASSPRVQGDARCREILEGLGAATGMADVVAAMTALSRRIDETAATPAVLHPAAEAPRPGRRTFRL